MAECVFCKIVSGEIPSKLLHSDELCVAFNDISPLAPVHILIIPREHISSASEVDASNSAAVAKIFETIPKLAKAAGIEDGFRIVTNCGESAGQTVKHLHFHLLGGRELHSMG